MQSVSVVLYSSQCLLLYCTAVSVYCCIVQQSVLIAIFYSSQCLLLYCTAAFIAVVYSVYCCSVQCLLLYCTAVSVYCCIVQQSVSIVSQCLLLYFTEVSVYCIVHVRHCIVQQSEPIVVLYSGMCVCVCVCVRAHAHERKLVLTVFWLFAL